MARFTAPEFAWLAARVEEVLWIPEKDYVPVARRVLPTKKDIDDGFKKLSKKKPKKRKPPGPTVPSQDNPMTVEQYNKWRAGMMAGSHGYRHTLKKPVTYGKDVPPYVYQEYPRVLYKAGKTCVVTEAKTHDAKLKAGWAETPDKARQKPAPGTGPPKKTRYTTDRTTGLTVKAQKERYGVDGWDKDGGI